MALKIFYKSLFVSIKKLKQYGKHYGLFCEDVKKIMLVKRESIQKDKEQLILSDILNLILEAHKLFDVIFKILMYLNEDILLFI